MGRSGSRRLKCLASDLTSERQRGSGRMLSRPLVKPGLLPGPTGPAERSAVTKELRGRPEKKTSRRQVETAEQRTRARRTRARPFLLQEKMTWGRASRVETQKLE